MFRRSQPPKPDREKLEQSLERIRDERKSDPQLSPDEITGVIDLALEELVDATNSTGHVEAAERMRTTSESVTGSNRPPPLPKD